jgi:hypothetical protein
MATSAKRTGQRVWIVWGSDTPHSYGRDLAADGFLGANVPVTTTRKADRAAANAR